MICWTDLETTGLEDWDLVLEVAAVLTGDDFEPVGLPFERIIPVPESRLRQMPDVVQNMHKASGLWEDVTTLYEEQHGSTTEWGHVDYEFALREVDDDLVAWFRQSGGEKGAALGGTGVAQFDRRKVRADLPGFDLLLHPYHTIDTGQVRRFCERVGASIPSAPSVETEVGQWSKEPHRALGDVEGALAEARAYRAWLLGGDR